MPTTSNFGWTTPADTDLVKDGAAAIRTLGNGIDTSFLDLKGGTTGQNLRKASNTDLDFTFAGDATNTVIDAEGDLLVGDSADTLQRLAIGTTGQILTVDTAVDGKIKWAAPAGGGKVLQVVSVAKDDTFSVASQTMTDVTGLSVSITPSSATSKILVLHQLSTGVDPSTTIMQARLLRDAVVINAGATASNRTLGFMSFASAASVQMVQSGAFLDSPATTSSLTYKIQVRATHSSATVYVNRSSGDEDNGERSRQASTITVLEIGA